ncbi:hypothetical protein TGAM01_v210800 [Trichoderma gamsii]|uniref:Protein bir1 n=1 Tax=Trichoderma gamsii TaxID=398673 RepID=A0A2P4Z7V1_9HYPO|nr:hypothetical protein TGAM01_v210800 [Trichoderma gamsii]PON20358.1 hypothetical protein TGAM01_v210800 [Trichoderma gamsii]
MANINFDQYFSYEARLASFQKTTKKRGSTTGGRGAAKALNWPHKQISATSLARAGFVFSPSPDSPDNTICFLCEKGLDGWEAGDDPVYEHVKHAPHCGWALVAAIEADIGDYAREDPNDPEMVEARKATFAGRWPHENKKGWKCKTKQLVEAGWKYTPTGESDDMATCAYCQLALDGWEQGDKPLDEHYNRSPDCPFFSLVSQYKALGKASNRGKSSRNSSVSGQSHGSTSADITNPSDMSVGFDDTLATVSSSATQPGAKKPRAKRGPAAKAGRKKTKKEEPSELLDESSPMEEDTQPPKLRRGQKRSSEAVEESTMSFTGEPTLKKRGSQLSVNDTIDSIAAHENDSEMTDVSSASYNKSGASSSRSKPGRKRASKLSSQASLASLRAPGGLLNDDEIERRLEADLEYHFTSEEEIAYDSDLTRNMAKASRTVTDSEAETTQFSKKRSAEYAMFDTAIPEPSEAEIEDELQALQAEMEVKEPAPKRGRKAGVQKTMNQLKPKKFEPESEFSESQKEDERVVSADISVSSTRSLAKIPNLPPPAGKRGRGRPRMSLTSQDESIGETDGSAQQPVKRGRGRPSRESLASLLSAESGDTHTANPAVKRGLGRPASSSLDSTGADEDSEATSALAPKRRGRPSKASSSSQNLHNYTAVGRSKDAYAPAKRGRGRPAKKLVEITPAEQTETEADDELIGAPEPSEAFPRPPKQSPLRAIFSPKEDALSLAPLPGTPSKLLSPVPSARQPVLSPSQSPQSSDAENQPPLSRAPAPGAAKRTILAPMATTPVHGSPSKRNVMTGLRSTTQWASASLEAIFGSQHGTPGKENDVDRFLKRGNELTSPERQMSVEEWIYFNAAEAEKKLKYECESLVNRFEMEGTRAIKVLEGLEVVEAEG